MDKVFVLVIYDICGTKSRNRLVKILKSYGYRVQKSGFEMVLRYDKYFKLMKELDKFDVGEDTIRVYKFKDKGILTTYGKQVDVNVDDVVVV